MRNRSVLAVGLVGILLTVVSVAENSLRPASVQEEDNRQPVDFTKAGGKYLGQIGNWCTGNLVGEAHVLTAAHCLGKEDRPFFYFQRNGYDVSNFARVTHVYRGNFTGSKTPEDWTNDWAIGELDRELGKEGNFLEVRPESFSPEFATNLAGYSSDRAAGGIPSIHRYCKVIKTDNGLYEHSCDMTFGASGGALLTFIQGKYYIVGVNSSSDLLTGQNYATPSSNFKNMVDFARSDFIRRKQSGEWAKTRELTYSVDSTFAAVLYEELLRILPEMNPNLTFEQIHTTPEVYKELFRLYFELGIRRDENIQPLLKALQHIKGKDGAIQYLVSSDGRIWAKEILERFKSRLRK